jgi:DNA-binding transcriptional LysR family regulator
VELNWDDLRYLLALRRAGSLGAAARMLKVEPSTVSRRLGSLESALGAKLAARTPEGLVLNDAAMAAADLAETVDQGVHGLVGRIGGDDKRPAGVVRLTTTDSIAMWIWRGLAPLREAHPAIRVDLVVSTAALDLARHEADVALRFFREKSPTLVTRKIGEFGWAVFASPAYLERKGVPPGGEFVLADHMVVGYSGTQAAGARWVEANSRPENIVLRADSVASAMNAVRSGVGVSALPCYVVEDHPMLVRLSPAVVTRSEVFVVTPPDHRETVRVRLVIEALADLFSRHRAMLEGP